MSTILIVGSPEWRALTRNRRWRWWRGFQRDSWKRLGGQVRRWRYTEIDSTAEDEHGDPTTEVRTLYRWRRGRRAAFVRPARRLVVTIFPAGPYEEIYAEYVAYSWWALRLMAARVRRGEDRPDTHRRLAIPHPLQRRR